MKFKASNCIWLYLMLSWLSLALLAACGVPVNIEQENLGVGGSSPQAVASSFFEDFNRALQDPALIDEETRQGWAERLSSYFTPSERVDQRAAFRQMLANFAYDQELLGPEQTLRFEITYTNIELVARDGERATVRLAESKIILTWVEGQGEKQTIVRRREGPLDEIIGQQNSKFPVVQINRRWFMTEG